MIKIAFLISLIAILAVQSSAQTADIFVKGDSNQCWLDVKDIMHRRSPLVTEDEKRRLLQAEHFSSGYGDLVLGVQVQVISDKNKKGEGGCRISVTVQWDESRIAPAQQSNQRHWHHMSMNQSDNFTIASLIASEAEAMKKARDKKPKGN
jgi:hypothetical protein